MLHKVLPVIIANLNSYLSRKLHIKGAPVILSELVTQEGLPLPAAHNKVVAMVTGIEQEHPLQSTPARNPARFNPPVQLNLQLLFAANFPGNYVEALKLISLVIGFFQGKRVFTPQNTPGLPSGVERITVEITNLDVQAQQGLWSAVGAKMVPAVIMKVRTITIANGPILQEVPEITATATPLQGS